MINELPYRERTKKENVILAGLWFGNEIPSPNLFMGSFREEFDQLHRGVDFQILNRIETVKVRAFLIAGTCDLCAKSLFLNIKQFNGIYGCSTCKIRAVRDGNVTLYPFVQNFKLRMTAETMQFAAEAHENGDSVFGVKGPSQLGTIAYKYVEGTAIDEMHCLSGHVKKLLSYWFDADYRVQGFFSGFSLFQFIHIVDSNIKNLKLPSFLPRIPRKVSDFAY